MAISEIQKVDYLWKKLAYGLSKTDVNENKRATNESIASPLLLRGENVWAQSNLVPSTIPGSSTSVVTVYPTSLPDETTADSSATLNRTWKTGLTDWIPPEYGSTYLVKVYVHTAGQPGSAASSGTQVFGAGSGNNDEWFFDYQSGILHFIGTNLPSGISGKSVYVSGARYTGIKGVAVPGAPADFTTLNVSGISTFIGNLQISSLTNNRIAIVGSGSTIEDDANLTFDGSTLAVGVDLDIDGRTELDITNISETLNVTGIATFASNVDLNASIDVDGRTELDITNISETLNVTGISTFASDIDINASIDVDGRTELDITNIDETLNVVGISTFASDIDINASIDVDGHTELDDVNVSTALTANNLIVTGSTLLSHSNSLKLQTTGIGISVSNGVGLTATIAGPTNLIIDPGVVGDNTGIVRIKGDLFVDGEQTQINSTTIELADFIVGVATTATSDLLTDGAGIQIGPNNTFLYEFNGGTNPSLKSSENLNVALGKVYQIDQTERLSADTLSLGTGTTIHSPASNALTFGTNGTEKVRITSDGDVGIGSVIPAGKLDVVGHTELDSVNVSGLSTFVSNVDINADLDVDGRTELDTTNISETLNVVGISTFESDIDINASIDVDGRTELDTTNISETLNVVGISTFESDVDLNADLDVDGRTELDITNISETLNVVGIATFANNIDANSDLDVDGRTELDITNISETLNVVGIATFASDIDINASIDVDGHTELDDVNVSGVTTTGGLLDINAGAQANTLKVEDLTNNRVVIAGTGGELEDDTNFTFDGSTLAVGVDLDIDGRTELDITNISETLNVTGISTFESDIDINASIDVDGRTELDTTNISETLNVVGIATFASNVDLNADLDVDGHTELDNLTVSGVSTFNNNVKIDGGTHTSLNIGNSSSFARIFIDSSGTYFGSVSYHPLILRTGNTERLRFGPVGDADFSVNVNVNADLDVDGHTELDNVNVSGVTTIGGLLDINAGAQANTFIVEDLTDNRVVLAGTGGELEDDANFTFDGTQLALGVGLSVTGVSTFASDIDINASIDVDGHTELDNLNVSGVSTFASNVDINANLDVSGNTNLNNLNVIGVATFVDAIDATSGAQANTFKVGDLTDNRVVIAGIDGELEDDANFTFDGTQLALGVGLTVTGVSTFAGAIDANGDLDVDGRTELDITNISETLNVTGISTFENDVNVGGALSVTGNAFFVGMVTFAAGTDGNITIGNTNTDNVVFNADINSGLIPNNNQTFDLGSSSQEWRNVYSKDVKVSTLTQNRVVFAGADGKLQTSGNLEFIDGSQLTVGASLTVTGNLDVDGHTELDDVNVSGVSTFTGAIDANGDLDVDGRTELDITNISETLNVVGVSTFAGNIDANGNLDVDGQTDLDILNVSETATFSSNIDANGDLDVDGRTELDITNISETLNVTGISTFASDIDINASIDVDGHTELDNLNVSGVSTFVSNVNLSSNLDVDGQTDLDVLNVSETATFSSNIDANGNLDVDGTTELDVLNVAETATFSSNIDANGNLDVDGTTELDVLNVAETATFSSNIDANGNLDVDGHTELDDVNVSGVSTFASNVDLNADLDVDGRTELDITNISETLNVTGIATFASDIDANGNLDVDGTTELDILNVAETATFNGRIVGTATTNVIPFLYSNLSDLPSASTYHGAFAHVHATGKAYYAHAGNWIELVNKNTGGVLDVVGQTELDNLNVSGVATATAFHTGALGSAIRITSDTISGPSEIVIDPAGVGDNTGALRIKGDLFVDGTQTIINSTSIELADFIVGIATTATTNILADGAGIGVGTDKFFTFDNTNTAFKSTENLNLESGHTYKIAGTDVLSATTLGSTVVNSSLTSLGTIATGVWQGTAINDDYIDTIDNANKVSISALNIDGGTDIGAVLADGDLIIVEKNYGAGAANRKADVVGITTYTFSKVSGDILINSSGAATIQANSIGLGTDTTGDFVQSISGTTNEIEVTGGTGENSTPQIGLPNDITVSNLLKVGTGITAQGGIITATTFDGTATTATNLTDGANIIGGTISDDRLPDLITSNIYVTSGISTFASVDLGNLNSTGIITATTFDGNINLDGNNITGSGSVNITGIITATSVEATDTVTTKILNVGAGGTVISANADTGTFAIGSATTSVTATMNGGAIPSIGLVIALGG